MSSNCDYGDCILCAARLSSNVSNEQACEILGTMNSNSYEAQRILFQQGEPNTDLFIIHEGRVKLMTTNSDGRGQIIGLATAGHIIGFDAVEDNYYSYTAHTLSPVIACKIRYKDMLRVLEQNPAVAVRLVEILNEELAVSKNLIRLLGHNGSMERVAMFILSLIPRHGKVSHDLSFPLSREEMAEMIGLRVETVSRVMADLQRKKVIEAPRGRIHILDPEKLRKLTRKNIPHS